jgi:molecular chaperone DnaJ
MPPAVAAGKPAGASAARPIVKAAPAPEAIRASILEMAAKLDKSTHFEILGVSGNATSDEVSVAFVRAARQFHPDRLAGTGLTDLQPQAERILSRINEAVMVLQNPGRRAEYVASLSAAAPPSTQNVPTVLEAENLFLKGEVFLKKGDHAKAIEAFTAAGKGNPEEPQYRAYLAWARFDDPRARKEAMVRETLKVLEGVLKDRPMFARGHYWLGLLWKFLNESPKAEHAFREAVQIDAAFIEAGRELRLIEMRRNKAQPKPKEPEPPRGLMGKLWKR